MIYHTPIWAVLAPRGERVEAGERLATCTRCPCSQLGRWCQLAFLLGFLLGSLVLVFRREKDECI